MNKMIGMIAGAALMCSSPAMALPDCARLVEVFQNPYASPMTRELALEMLRVQCLGSTPDGSRQLREPVAKSHPKCPWRNAAGGDPCLRSPDGPIN